MYRNRFLAILHSLLLLLFLSTTLALPRTAYALNESEVEGKSDEDLEQDAWETRRKNAIPGSVKCGLWSILISTVWRGWGHHCAEDESSHYRLLIMEGVSLAMIATSLAMGSLSRDDKHLSPLWKTLFHFGTTLFISSYLFDVIGTFKGYSMAMPTNHIDPYGHGVQVGVRWAPSDSLNLGLEFEYAFRNKRFWVKPYAFLDVIALNHWNAGLDSGVVLWHAEESYTYIAIAADTKYDQALKSDYDTITFLPYVEFSLDLGTWFAHLSQIRFVNRLGFGVNFYQFKEKSSRPFSDHATLLVLESFISMNIFTDFNLAVGYRQRPDFSIGPLSAPSRLFNTVPVPGFGVFSLDLSFHISAGWHTDLQMNFGTSAEFWLNVAKRF
ncbi:MAG: hypothetical protein WC966_09915 [Bradymonadales bacterium]|jgi:hypothetical protein